MRSNIQRLAFLVGLSATMQTWPSPSQAQTPAYECNIALRVASPRPATYVGKAAGTNKAAVDRAWNDVCRQLPVSDQPDCRTSKKYSSRVESSGAARSTTVTLTPVPALIPGKGSSTETLADAHRAALAAACQQAGGEADCISTTGFEVVRDIHVTRASDVRVTVLEIVDIDNLYIDASLPDSPNPNPWRVGQSDSKGPTPILETLDFNGKPTMYHVWSSKSIPRLISSSLFTNNAVHLLVGTIRLPGPYVFTSSPDEALRFRCDAQKGYVYVGGRGTVSLPDGATLQFGAK